MLASRVARASSDTSVTVTSYSSSSDFERRSMIVLRRYQPVTSRTVMRPSAIAMYILAFTDQSDTDRFQKFAATINCLTRKRNASDTKTNAALPRMPVLAR